MRAAIVLASLVAVSGCVAPAIEPSTVGGSDPSRILPYLDASDAHDHASPAAHDAGWNLAPVGWTAFGADAASLPSYRFNQVQVFGTHAFVSAYAAPPEGRPGLVVVDLSDPARPIVVAAFDSGRLVPIDVHLSEDGKFLALAGHRLTASETAALPAQPPPVPCTSAPAGPAFTVCAPFVPFGVEILDVSDPASPKLLASHVSAPSGAHTVKLATIGGALHAFVASYGFSYANRLASGVEILRYEPDGPLGPHLRPVSRFLPREASGGPVFMHDMYVAPHPVTGETLLYGAYWDGGVVIANVDDPSKPLEIASWKEFDAATYGNVHFVQPMRALLHERHVTVAAPEFGSAEHAGEMYVVDTTDPTHPVRLGRWALPGNPVSERDYMHSPHNFDLAPDGRLAYGHYHGGVWVLDLDPVVRGAADEPSVLAYRFPVPPVEAGITLPDGAFAPNVWNAAWVGPDRVIASDIQAGVHVLDLESRTPGAPPYAGLV